MVTLSPGSLSRHSTGDVLARLGNDVERTEVLVYSGPGLMVADALATVFFTLVLFVISWRLSLASLVVLPPVAFVAMRYAHVSAVQLGLRATEPRVGSRSLRRSSRQVRLSMLSAPPRPRRNDLPPPVPRCEEPS